MIRFLLFLHRPPRPPPPAKSFSPQSCCTREAFGEELEGAGAHGAQGGIQLGSQFGFQSGSQCFLKQCFW
jgi:hypothetical protein